MKQSKYTNEEIIKRKNKESKRKNIISICVYIIIIPILIYNVMLIIKAIANPKETPSFLGIKTYVIISGSMEPNIKIGDIVIAKSVKSKEEAIKVGDIIAYRKGQQVITHRITKIEKDENGILRITAKGDNNNIEDSEKILINNIEGKVIGIIPRIGYVTLILKDKILIIIVFIMADMCIERTEKRKKQREIRRQKRIKYEKEKRGSERYEKN